tara:strand:+ start:999 stop:1214 length:216 start_codon:yes stop_codon:yes gene_type:complete
MIDEDERGQPFIKVDFNVNDVRLLYNAVDFYLENRVEVLDGKEEIKDPTENVVAMKRLLYQMVLEANFHLQ